MKYFLLGLAIPFYGLVVGKSLTSMGAWVAAKLGIGAATTATSAAGAGGYGGAAVGLLSFSC